MTGVISRYGGYQVNSITFPGYLSYGRRILQNPVSCQDIIAVLPVQGSVRRGPFLSTQSE